MAFLNISLETLDGDFEELLLIAIDQMNEVGGLDDSIRLFNCQHAAVTLRSLWLVKDIENSYPKFNRNSEEIDTAK